MFATNNAYGSHVGSYAAPNCSTVYYTSTAFHAINVVPLTTP